ncbi:hypothetical protein U9M48_044492, partial [Paspalum notatum var. saurae]
RVGAADLPSPTRRAPPPQSACAAVAVEGPLHCRSLGASVRPVQRAIAGGVRPPCEDWGLPSASGHRCHLHRFVVVVRSSSPQSRSVAECAPSPGFEVCAALVSASRHQLPHPCRPSKLITQSFIFGRQQAPKAAKKPQYPAQIPVERAYRRIKSNLGIDHEDNNLFNKVTQTQPSMLPHRAATSAIANSPANPLPFCGNCLAVGHFVKVCSGQIRCLFCFNYGHRAKHCIRRLSSSRVKWTAKTKNQNAPRDEEDNQAVNTYPHSSEELVLPRESRMFRNTAHLSVDQQAEQNQQQDHVSLESQVHQASAAQAPMFILEEEPAQKVVVTRVTGSGFSDQNEEQTKEQEQDQGKSASTQFLSSVFTFNAASAPASSNIRLSPTTGKSNTLIQHATLVPPKPAFRRTYFRKKIKKRGSESQQREEERINTFPALEEEHNMVSQGLGTQVQFGQNIRNKPTDENTPKKNSKKRKGTPQTNKNLRRSTRVRKRTNGIPMPASSFGGDGGTVADQYGRDAREYWRRKQQYYGQPNCFPWIVQQTKEIGMFLTGTYGV